MYVKAEPTTDLNRNTEWFTYPGVWTTYILMIFVAWLAALSLFGCSPGMAWTIAHLCHFVVSLIFSSSFCKFFNWVRIVCELNDALWLFSLVVLIDMVSSVLFFFFGICSLFYLI